MWILYGGYHVVRASVAGNSKKTISAVLGVVLFLNLPIVWKSVEWWRGSLHPKSVTMTGEMRQVLLFSMMAWIVFFAAVLERRLRLEWAREAAAREAATRDAEPGPGSPEARRA